MSVSKKLPQHLENYMVFGFWFVSKLDISNDKKEKLFDILKIKSSIIEQQNFYSSFLEDNKKISNKGTGAGGANTNIYGGNFEEKTNNQSRLLNLGYVKIDNNCFSKKFDYKTVIFAPQNGLKKYMKDKHNIDLFRNPDESYVIEYNSGKNVVKILEKKVQNIEGSVETKLWSGPSLKREYELVLGDNFEIVYGFCVNNFLKQKLISNNKKYIILKTILNENNIEILFGDDENYFETLERWFNNSL